MNMKQICFITQCSLPVPTVKGGAVETLVEYIIDENEKKHCFDITVISVADSNAEVKSNLYKHTKFVYVPKASNIVNFILSEASRIFKYININLPASFEFSRIPKVIKAMPEQDVYIYEAGPTTHLALLKRIIPKEKLAVHIHWDGMGSKWKDDCFQTLIPVSKYIGEQWQKATNCSEKKIRPLLNCTKIERFAKELNSKEKDELKKFLQIPKENKVIIYTGRIVKEKGVKELLKAFSAIKRSDLTLLIIGSANFGSKTKTSYEREVTKLIQESDKQIVFTGYVHQTQLYKYYSIADIAVMPSLFQDPAPLVCIETQATGTPLIATKVGGIPEYVDNGGVVLIEKNNNLVSALIKTITDLLDDEEHCKEMTIREKENSRKFSTEAYFDNFRKIIDEILQ